jgi:hypothetical protein
MQDSKEMIYPYRLKASKSDNEIKSIESIIHQKDIEFEMKKRGQKQENGVNN